MDKKEFFDLQQKIIQAEMIITAMPEDQQEDTKYELMPFNKEGHQIYKIFQHGEFIIMKYLKPRS